MSGLVLIWYDEKGQGPLMALTGLPSAEVGLSAAAKLLEMNGNMFQRIAEGLAEDPGLYDENHPVTVIEAGAQTVTIQKPCVGFAISFDEDGAPIADVSLGARPTAPQLWAAALLADETARANIRGKIAAKARQEATFGELTNRGARRAIRSVASRLD